MKPLDHPVSLRMKSCGFVVDDTQQGTDDGPQGCGKLSSPVTRDNCWNSEPCNPPVEQGGSTLLLRYPGEELLPASE